MIGQIIKRGKGKRPTYSVVIYQGKVEGQKRYQWVTCKTRREAEKKLAELVHQRDTGRTVYTRSTLGDFVTRWLKDYARQNLSPRTAEGYESIARAHLIPKLGKIELKNLKPSHIQDYYTQLLEEGKSTTTVRHHAMMLHKVLDQAVKWQLLVRNPADAVAPPRARHTDMHTLDQDQATLIMEEVKGSKYYPLFFFGLYTGMRRSEILALRWADIDLMLMTASVNRSMHRLIDRSVVFRGTKTAKSSRVVALTPATCGVLRQHLDNEMAQCHELGVKFTNDRLVFCQWDGQPLIPATVSQYWRRVTKQLGIEDIHFHSLRHSHATMMLKQGIHPKIVQERLGHSSIAITMDTYSHVTQGMQRQAADSFDKIMLNAKGIAKE